MYINEVHIMLIILVALIVIISVVRDRYDNSVSEKW